MHILITQKAKIIIQVRNESSVCSEATTSRWKLLFREFASLCVYTCSAGLLAAVKPAVFSRAMLRKRGLCYHAVCVCLFVCLRVSVTFIHSVKTNKHIFKIFTLSGKPVILVFPYQTAWQYSDGNPHNECRWGRQKSRFWANIRLHCVLWTVPAASAIHLAATNHSEYITLVAGERPSLLMAVNNDEVYDKKPHRYAEDIVTQW